MKRITCAFYTFEELNGLFKEYFFTNHEDFEIEVVDKYFWRIVYYPDDMDGDDGLTLSDFDALPVLSKVVGFPLSNTHVSRDGIWLEGFPEIPKRSTAKKRDR